MRVKAKKCIYGTNILLLSIFVLALAIRFVPLFTHDHPMGVDAYYHFRQAEQFKTGYDSFDELSFGGRPYVYQPTFHFFLAALSIMTFLPVETVAPIAVTLLGALTVVVVFFIVRRVFKNDTAALLSAAFLAVTPVFIWKTSSNTLLTAVDMFLLSLAILFLLKQEKTKYLIAASVLFLFNPLIGLLAMCLNIAYCRPNASHRKIDSVGNIKGWKWIDFAWLLLFIAFIISSLHFLPAFEKIYISKDLPQDILAAMNENIDISGYLFRVNVFAVGFGIFGLYLARKKVKNMLPLLMVLAVSLASLALGVIETDRALVYAVLPLSVFAGFGASEVLKRKPQAFGIMLIILAASTLWGFVSLGNLEWSAIPDSEYAALEWLKNSSSENATILATPIEGHWITYVSRRKNVIDTHLLGATDFTERFDDVMTFYRTDDNGIRDGLIKKYNISYVFYSDRFARSGFSIEKLNIYAPVYQNGSTVVFKV